MDSKKPIELQADLGGVSTRKDGSLSLRFGTQELSPVEKAHVMEYLNEFGWLLFKPNEFSEEDIPKQDAEYEGKTPSQRLRNVLFVLWKQLGEDGDFEDFYRKRVNLIVEQIKKKLD